MGGKELLDLIDWLDDFRVRRGEALIRTDPNWLDTSTFASHTMFMRELLGYPIYNFMRKNGCINKFSSIKCKAFEISENLFPLKLKLWLDGQRHK
jgi:hypothetical protein